jgi:phage terminase small subunit
MTRKSKADVPAWAKDLTNRERVFVEEYLVDLNASQAFIRAGLDKHNSADSKRKRASEMLAKPAVCEAIEHLLQARGVTRTWVIDQLARIAHCNLSRFFTFDGESITWKPHSELDPEDLAMLAEVSETVDAKSGIRIIGFKFHNSRESALARLAKLLRMEVNRTEVTGANGGPIEMVDPLARLMDGVDEIAKRNHAEAVGKPESS